MARVNKLLFCGALCTGLMTGAAGAKEIDRNTAQMQAMDKITGRVSVIDAPVNGEVNFGSFSIVVRACRTTPPEETPENYAFVDVADSSFGKVQYNIFKGWMMSSSPALNAVEHPIYDVWLLKCYDSQIKPEYLLTAEQLKDREGLPKLSELKKDGETAKTPTAEADDLVSLPAQPTDETVLPEDTKALESKVSVVPEVLKDKVEPTAEESREDGAPQSLIQIPAPEAEQAPQPSTEMPDALPPLPKIPAVTSADSAMNAPIIIETETVVSVSSKPEEVKTTVPAEQPKEAETKLPAEETQPTPAELPESDIEIIEEEDQFIDFSKEAESLKNLEAELSAEALKSE